MRPVLVLAGMVILILAVAFFSRTFLSKEEPAPVVSRIHYFRTPAILLNEISVKVYYVVPREQTNSLPEIKTALNDSFRKIAHFHGVQFLGKSFIKYDIAEEPVISEADWNGPSELFAEDPSLLETLNNEVKTGQTEGGYPVRVYVVAGKKGVGAAPGAVYVPDELFLDPKWSDVKESVLYHMLGESFGLPRGDEGVMGVGMFRPLEITFLEPQLVQKMGLLN